MSRVEIPVGGYKYVNIAPNGSKPTTVSIGCDVNVYLCINSFVSISLCLVAFVLLFVYYTAVFY